MLYSIGVTCTMFIKVRLWWLSLFNLHTHVATCSHVSCVLYYQCSSQFVTCTTIRVCTFNWSHCFDCTQHFSRTWLIIMEEWKHWTMLLSLRKCTGFSDECMSLWKTVMYAYQCWLGIPDKRSTFPHQLQTKISTVLSSMANYVPGILKNCSKIDEVCTFFCLAKN